MVVKGRNRDTAWFAMTDGDWAWLKPAWEAWLDPANFDAEGRQRRRARGADGAVPGGVGPGRGEPEGAAVRRWQRRWKDGWVGDLDAPGARRNAAIDMLVFDHGLLRKVWRNAHEIDAGVWRSNQPDPAMIRRLAGAGLQGDFESAGSDGVRVVSARAGGVPGGGDRVRRFQADLAQRCRAGRRSWRSTRFSRGCRGRFSCTASPGRTGPGSRRRST